MEISRRTFLGTALTAGALTVLGTPLTAQAETSAEVQAQADAMSAQLEVYQEQLDLASDAYYTAMGEHDAAVTSMNEQQAIIDDCQTQISTLQEHLGSRAAEMYRNGKTSYLEVLLGATSFDDFITSWDFLNELNQDDADSVAQVKDLRQKAEDAHAEYAAQEQVAAQKLAEAEQAQADAEAAVESAQTQLDSLNAEAAALLAQEQAAAEAAAAASAGSYVGGVNANTGNVVVDAAYSQLGVPYVWGGTEPGVGLDCSGLVQYCYACAGVYLPRTSQDQRNAGTHISIDDASPGDILGNSHHVAIYIGGGSFIEEPQTGMVCRIASDLGRFVDATRIG